MTSFVFIPLNCKCQGISKTEIRAKEAERNYVAININESRKIFFLFNHGRSKVEVFQPVVFSPVPLFSASQNFHPNPALSRIPRLKLYHISQFAKSLLLFVLSIAYFHSSFSRGKTKIS